MRELEGKIALVTGASRGLGRGVATVLAEKGATVIVNFRSGADAAAEKTDLLKGDAVAHLLAENMLFEGERVVKVLP